MRRADRLFQIIQLIRSRKVTTARWLAEELEISERTVYRDIRDLMTSGVPIDGEAGIGYILRRGFDLPPLMFNKEEIAALTLGARIVQSWGDPSLAKSAKQALDKIENVLPDTLKNQIEHTALFSPMTRLSITTANTLADLRSAISRSEKINIIYHRKDGTQSSRTLQPLGLFFWGQVWTLGAWCELRESFRSFRVDRIEKLDLTGEKHTQQKGQMLEDYIQFVQFNDKENNAD